MDGTLGKKVFAGKRVGLKETLKLLSYDDIYMLAQAANERCKAQLKEKNVVTYIVDRNINYSNICTMRCRFCAFYKDKTDKAAYLLDYNKIFDKIQEAVKCGGRQILIQGGLHPDLSIEYYESLFKRIKSDFSIHIHGLSPPEIIHISCQSGLTIEGVIRRLRNAGLDSIPGGGAEILDDSIRAEISPQKCTSSEWLKVMETAHRIGMKTTATMMFGHKESLVHIANHLLLIRNLQEKTGGFTAFIPWTFQSGNTKLGGIAVSSLTYLKVLAVSRIVLDNIKNIQASWVTQGDKIAQLALFFGANDMGSTMLEENVVASAGVSFKMSEDMLRRLITDIGLTPKRRNMFYEYDI